MALIKADRVKETSTSETTANFILGGAATGYRSFSSVCSVGDTFYYAISNQSNGEWEVGLGTYGATGTLDRTTVHASSNANAKVVFSAGNKDCFITLTKNWIDSFLTATSGTTNYLTKTTGTGTIGDSQIFDNGTNVGIGTTSPSAELHVYSTASPQLRIEGSSDAYLALYRSNVYGGYIGLGSAGTNDIYVYNANSGAFRVGLTNGNLQALYVSPSSNVGINEGGPGAQLQVTTAAAATKALIVKGASAQSANLQEWQNSSGTALAVIDSTGDLGIGTTSPSFKLQVDAASVDANIVANVTSGYGGIGVYAAGVNKAILGYAGSSTNYGSQTIAGDVVLKTNNTNFHITTGSGNAVTTAYFSSAGNIGIGTTSPSDKLHVVGGVTYLQKDSVYTDYVGQLILQGSTNGSKRLALGYDTTNNVAFLQSYINSVGPSPILLNPNTVGTGSATVGVGAVTSPAGQLHVQSHADATKSFVVRARASQTANLTEWQNSSGNAYAAVNSNFGAQFHGWSGDGPHGGVEQVCISAGNKSFWTAGDAALLTIGFADIAGVYDGTNWSMYFKTGSSSSRTERMRITSTGSVGIGTSSPAAQLHTTSSAAATKALVVRGASGQSASLQEWQNNAGTALASIDSSGRLTIASSATASNADLYINNASSVNPAIKWNGVTGQTGLRFYSGSSLIAAVQDNGAIRATTLQTWGGVVIGDYYINRTGSGTISFGADVNGAGADISTGSNSTLPIAARVNTTFNTTKGLVVKGAASQTANLQEWQNNSGTALASIDSAGNFGVNSITSTGAFDTYFDTWYGAVKRRVYRVNVPSTIGNYQEIFRLNWSSNVIAKIKVLAFGNGIANAKEYDFNSSYGMTGVLVPLRSAYLYNTVAVQYELENDWSAGTGWNTIRVKRTSGTDALNLFVYVEVLDATSGHPQAVSGTGTSSIGGILGSYASYTSIAPPDVVGGNGNGYQLSLYGGNALGTGNGGNILLQAGALSTSGSNGKVIVRGLASNTANLQEWQNNAGAALSAVKSDGSIQPASLADSAATNNSIYYSTTAGKLVYKDSSGTVNNLY